MRHVPTLLRRELGAYFLGPMAFLILLAFQVIAWLNFWELVDTLSRPQAVVLEPARPAEHLHLGEHAVLDRAAGRRPRPDDAADRRGAAVRDDRDPPDRAGDRDRGRGREVAGGGGDVPGPAAAVRDLPAVPLLPGKFHFDPGPVAGRWGSA